MIKQIYKNNLSISYKDEGVKNERVIVLIHGFLETFETWKNFSKELSNKFRVISVNLPGHGESTLHQEPYTMCKYAESVKNVLEYEDIKSAFVIGHSLGGYVAMAFAENYSKLLSALCLFHSVPFADSNEKKNNRTNLIKRIKKGEKNEIYTAHSKEVYSNENIKKFSNEIKTGEQIAKQLSDESVIASIKTMQERDDRSNILKVLQVPFLYIAGRNDNFISFETVSKIEMPEKYKIEILENSGHMGMVEEKEKSLKLINDFILDYF